MLIKSVYSAVVFGGQLLSAKLSDFLQCNRPLYIVWMILYNRLVLVPGDKTSDEQDDRSSSSCKTHNFSNQDCFKMSNMACGLWGQLTESWKTFYLSLVLQWTIAKTQVVMWLDFVLPKHIFCPVCSVRKQYFWATKKFCCGARYFNLICDILKDRKGDLRYTIMWF